MAPTPDDGRLAYRPAEAAKALDVSDRLFDEWLRDGLIASLKQGGVRLVPRWALDEFLRRASTAASGEGE